MLRVLTVILLIPIAGLPQPKDTPLKKPDSLAASPNNISGAAYEDAKLDLGTYFRLLGEDLKQQALSPLHTSKKDWLKVGAVAAATGVVTLANKPINRFATKVRNQSKTVANVSKYITNFGGAYEVYAIAGFYTYGLIFRRQKEKTTTVLATQAYITAGILSTVAKYLFGEQRPYYTDPNSSKSGPIFHGPFYPFKKGLDIHDYSSFPSGHTTAAFAAATVYALEYRDKPLIPIISYSAATLIGLSRLTENQHWATDVLAGAMLGYLSGRQVVNNFHHFSKLKRGRVANAFSVNLQYVNRQFLPGLIFKF